MKARSITYNKEVLAKVQRSITTAALIAVGDLINIPHLFKKISYKVS